MKVHGNVISGHGRGEKILGFPTFNVDVKSTLELPFGIFAAWVYIGTERYRGALHYGPVPTFHDPNPTFEVFVLDYHSDVRVKSLTVEPVHFLREIVHFSSPEDLKEQIEKDVALVRQKLI